MAASSAGTATGAATGAGAGAGVTADTSPVALNFTACFELLRFWFLDIGALLWALSWSPFTRSLSRYKDILHRLYLKRNDFIGAKMPLLASLTIDQQFSFLTAAAPSSESRRAARNCSLRSRSRPWARS